MPVKSYRVIGLMSGTSLDGVDLAYCLISEEEGRWQYRILESNTLPYSSDWIYQLKSAHELEPEQLKALDLEYGKYLGELVKTFATAKQAEVDFVASHGHTVLHQPNQGITLQIGDGHALASTCGCHVVCDFRSEDVRHGGQGAPLVPIGDQLLFADFDYCLNLGGFANISYAQNGVRLAQDICPVNIVFNEVAQRLGKAYDGGGTIAAGGKVIEPLLEALNDIPFYHQPPPKSLGREWLEESFMPLLTLDANSSEDIMATVNQHAAMQIAQNIELEQAHVLVTGGGAFNQHLLDNLHRQLPGVKWAAGDTTLINFKEALIFALLGVLRWRDESNCLASVTGASKDVSGGVICAPC